jgi:hypothetical protein
VVGALVPDPGFGQPVGGRYRLLGPGGDAMRDIVAAFILAACLIALGFIIGYNWAG